MIGHLRNRLRALFRTGILVRVTNFGLGFILMTLVVAIGATNTGNNGLYILVSLFLAALVVSGIVSRRNVENVTALLEGPDEIWAGEPARFTLTLKNGGRLPRRALLAKIAGAQVPLLFARVPAGGEASRGVDLVFPRRGRRRVESALVYSGYPIGLFRKGRLHEVGQERTVYPARRLVPIPRPDPRVRESGDPRSTKRGRGPEIRHLRDAGIGDDPRDVHWPQTARQGRFIIKERAAEEGRDALVVLDLVRPERAHAAWDAAFETAVCEAAGILLQLHTRGDRVGLVLGSRVFPPGSGPAHRRALLLALALVEPVTRPEALVALPPGLSLYPVRAAA